jgi:tetratricopeptide (TPR) repeat protein
MASVSTLKKRAAEFTSKGQFDQAVQEYQKILKVNDNDPGTHNLLGDLYLKMGKRDFAFEEFERSVELYTTEEFYSNAVAVAKKVLRLDADQAIIYKQLGDLYAKQGLMGDAISNIMDYADRKKAEGAMDDVCEAYQKAIEWMPKRVDLRMSLADLYITQMNNDEAINVLKEVAELFREQEKFENAEGIDQRIRDLGGVVEEMPSVEPSIAESAPSEIASETSAPDIGDIKFEQMETAIEDELAAEAPEEEKIEVVEEEIEEEKVYAEEIPSDEATLNLEETISGEETLEETPPTIEEPDKIEEPISAEETTIAEVTSEKTTLSFEDVMSQTGESKEESEEPLFKTSPSDLESYVELGEMCLSIGSEEEAIEHFYTAADSYLEQENFEKSNEIYSRIASLRPKELRCREVILQTANDRGTKDDKIKAHLDLGECLIQRGSEEEAKVIYQKLLEVDSKNPIALKWAEPVKPEKKKIEEIAIQELLDEHVEPDTLLEEFRDGLDQTLETGDTASHYDLGITYKEMGLLDEAIDALQKASEGNKEKLKALEMLGLCYIEKGEMESAAFQFIQALRLEGYSPEEKIGLQYNLGLAYETMGQKKKALDVYEEAFKVNAKFKDLEKKLAALREETSGVIRRDKKRREKISYV